MKFNVWNLSTSCTHIPTAIPFKSAGFEFFIFYTFTHVINIIIIFYYSLRYFFQERVLYCLLYVLTCRSQWPRGLRRRSAAARLLRSWVRIQPGARIFVCCECCVLSGRGLCDELITRPKESYLLWCVVVCDLETSRMRRPWPAVGRSAREKNNILRLFKILLSRMCCLLSTLSVNMLFNTLD